MEDSQCGPYGGHFAVSHLYGALALRWWWEGMYTDVLRFCQNCPKCAVCTGSGRHDNPPLHPICVQRPFQIIGVDIMDLPRTKQGICSCSGLSRLF